MPRLFSGLPKYRKHRASGQAIVTLSGRDIYLGRYGTKASKLEYDRHIAEWLAAGRQRPVEQDPVHEPTVVELLARYWTFAKRYYVKDGRPTSEQHLLRVLIRDVRALYGRPWAVTLTNKSTMILKCKRRCR